MACDCGHNRWWAIDLLDCLVHRALLLLWPCLLLQLLFVLQMLWRLLRLF